MRAPRYRFPDEVRSTTRSIASRMVREGTIARTPEELEAWIARTPDVQRPLEEGGYHTAFTAHDLFPLLQVFVVKAGGPAPEADAPPRSSRGRWIAVGLLLVVLIMLLVIAVATAARAQQQPGGVTTRAGAEQQGGDEEANGTVCRVRFHDQRSSGCRGRRSVKMLPLPGVLRTVRSPAMARARSRLIASPNPTPSLGWFRRRPTC
jgi:hypothetical protein